MIYFPKWKIVLVALVCLFGAAYSLPNFLGKQLDGLPAWLPSQKVNLGLDLQGGSHLLLEVEIEQVIAEYLEGIADGIRTELRRAQIRGRNIGVQGNTVSVTLSKAEDVERTKGLISRIEPGARVSVEGTKITLTPLDQTLVERRNSALQQSIEIIRRRVDQTGTREPTIQRQGDKRVLVQLPGLDDPERIKRLLGETAKLTFHLVDLEHSAMEAKERGRVPPGTLLLEATKEDAAVGRATHYLVKRRALVSGEDLVDAHQSFDQRSNQPVVTFRLNARGAKKFSDVTTKNVEKPFAIVLDKKVISAPVIREPIITGNGQISGSFTVQTAQDLALLLRAGALPAPIKILEERTVGASLGADSIESGKIASIIGLIAVIVFMALYYGRFGVMADIALLFNMLLILGTLSVIQATLTLPGIAGIVLTIGMAVDANVLIFERMREEVRAGRTPISAVDAGYSRALTTIVDANVTTLIAAVLLYAFGSGPVRGFAVTLAIGIGTSMFTAIMVTRLMVVTWLRRARPQELKI
ncbi:MAG: protein translocase subunit SecD [Rhodospirillaceae bacterium]